MLFSGGRLLQRVDSDQDDVNHTLKRRDIKTEICCNKHLRHMIVTSIQINTKNNTPDGFNSY